MPQLTPDEERELRNWALTWAEGGHVQGRLTLKVLDRNKYLEPMEVRNRKLQIDLKAALEVIEEFNSSQGEDSAKQLHPDG